MSAIPQLRCPPPRYVPVGQKLTSPVINPSFAISELCEDLGCTSALTSSMVIAMVLDCRRATSWTGRRSEKKKNGGRGKWPRDRERHRKRKHQNQRRGSVKERSITNQEIFISSVVCHWYIRVTHSYILDIFLRPHSGYKWVLYRQAYGSNWLWPLKKVLLLPSNSEITVFLEMLGVTLWSAAGHQRQRLIQIGRITRSWYGSPHGESIITELAMQQHVWLKGHILLFSMCLKQ